MEFNVGSTHQSLDVLVVDDNGLVLTGKKAANFPAAFYSLAGPNANVAFPAFVDLLSITAAYTPGGIFERGQGVYRMDLPDGMFASIAKVKASCEASGFHVMFPWFEVIQAEGTGTGAYTVTITVNDGVNPISGANVRLTSGLQTYQGATNASGQVVFNVDANTWTVGITAAGYSFAGASLVVTGATASTYSMSAVTITPSAPGYTTGYLTCYDQNGVVEQNVNVSATLVQLASTDTGHAFDGVAVTKVSDINGLVQFPNMVLGATYRLVRGTAANTYLINIPTTAGTTLALNSLIGSP